MTVDSENPAQKVKGARRSQAEKVGNWAYLWRRLDRLERKVGCIDHRTRGIFRGLREFMRFDAPYVQEVVCRNNIDAAILQVLLEAGSEGALPSAISTSLTERGFEGVDRFKVTRSIQRMNRTMGRETGEKVAEKRGHHWALTSFMQSVYSSTIREVKGEGRRV